MLKVNDYGLGKHISIFDAEQKGKKHGGKKKSGMQIAGAPVPQNHAGSSLPAFARDFGLFGVSPGRDYDNESHCTLCWDGGDLVLCDGCPCSYHEKCLTSFLVRAGALERTPLYIAVQTLTS